MDLRLVLRRARGLALCLALTTALSPSVLAQSAPASNPVEEGYLLGDKVFTEPTTTSPEITDISRDVRVRIEPFPEREGWHVVYRAENGERLGFAFNPYVSRFNSQGITTLAPEESRTVTLPASDGGLREVVFTPLPENTTSERLVRTWANVRLGPGMNYEAFGVIRPGVAFPVLSVSDGWGRLALEGEHATGYVSASLLHLPAPPPVAVTPKPTVSTPPTAAAEPEPMRGAILGEGQAAGGVSETGPTQAEALRQALTGSGVDAERTVYVTRTGRKFHREGCRHLRSRTFAIPLVEAMLDYSPCRTCKPLQPVEDPEGEEAPDPD